MAKIVYEEIVDKKNKAILSELRRIVQIEDYFPKNIKEIVGKIFCTCYMGTKNSSVDTLRQAEAIAKDVGSNHFSIKIDDIFNSFKKLADDTFSV